MSRNRSIRVWAPSAKALTLSAGGKESPMARDGVGWWSLPAPPHPYDYAFCLDGGPPLPDPRSPCQPDGVHGYSRSVDQRAFQWTDERWQAPPLASALIYELHIGTFTAEGTFDAAIERIPHLVELGVTHVEMMPVAAFPGEWGWGYDGVDLWAPHRTYGGPDGLKRMVNALHAHGIAVLLDVVYNHLGPDGNYLRQFGPYFTTDHKTPWGEAVNLSGAGSNEVRRFFIENALMWLRDYHLDGLRLDAVHTFMDASAKHFLEELACEVLCLEAATGRHLCLIAESDLNDPRIIQAREAGGYALSAQWSDDFHHAVHTVLTQERGGYYQDFGSFAHLAKALENGFVYDGCHSHYRGRPHGRPLDNVPLARLVCALQNHDQIGNRAHGERFAELAGAARQKIAAALLMTGPFVPMIFQGEEWAASSPFLYFTSHTDPGVARAVTEGRRRDLARFESEGSAVADPQDPQTFLRSKLHWDEIKHPRHREMLAWYRKLIALRRLIPALRTAEVRVRFEEGQWIVVDRVGVAVLINLGPLPVRLPHARGMRLCLASDDRVESGKDATRIPPDAVAILASDDAVLPLETESLALFALDAEI